MIALPSVIILEECIYNGIRIKLVKVTSERGSHYEVMEDPPTNIFPIAVLYYQDEYAQAKRHYDSLVYLHKCPDKGFIDWLIADITKHDRGYKQMKMVHDLTDPADPEGRSFKEVNLTKTHKWPIGTLVECTYANGDNYGVRMFVAELTRDCDGTPLYTLTPSLQDIAKLRFDYYQKFSNRIYLNLDTGHSENSLRLVSLPDAAREQRIEDWVNTFKMIL